ncbi:hypothetical protein JCM15765_38940 [Paradesulfitobacterium aromaticivorans]
MITDAIITAVLAILTWLVNLFPNSSLDLSALEQFVGAIAGVNYFVEISALITVLGIVVSFELTMMTIRGVIWIWRLVKP